MKKRLTTTVRIVMTLASLWRFTGETRARETNLLLHYTNVWHYLDTGVDPGAEWTIPAFDDSAWPAGPGPFGFEPILATPPNPPYPYPLAVQTPLSLGSPVTPAHFFRTHFTLTDFPIGMELMAQCYVDDSLVLYLNGTEVQRLFIGSNQTYQTFSQQSSSIEGTNYTFFLPTNLAIAGDNLIAVEVHQNYVTSSDVFWAMKLLSVAPRPLTITRQPIDLATNTGARFLFDVTAEGGPAWFQWYHNGTAISDGSKQSSLEGGVAASSAGTYQVLVTNLLGAATSAVAMLTVVPDSFAPVVDEATVQHNGATGQSNAIHLKFSERMTSAAATSNFVVTDLESGAVVEVLLAQLNANLVRLTVGGPNWVIGRRYRVTVNGVKDIAGNTIATNTQIEAAWPTMLIAPGAVWHYHSRFLADPAIVDVNWSLPAFQENEHWLLAPAPFGQSLPATSCFLETQTILQNQAHPSLFRRPFLWPNDAGAKATVQFGLAFERGFCLYLNGREVYRSSLAQPADTPISADTHGSGTPSPGPSWRCDSPSLTLSNLVAGTNWLAAAVFPPYFSPNTGNFQVNAMGFDLSATLISPAARLPGESVAPHLTLSWQPPDRVVLAWTGTNSILQRKTSFSTSEEWVDVTPLTNSPVVQPVDSATGFFRLRQP